MEISLSHRLNDPVAKPTENYFTNQFTALPRWNCQNM